MRAVIDSLHPFECWSLQVYADRDDVSCALLAKCSTGAYGLAAMMALTQIG